MKLVLTISFSTHFTDENIVRMTQKMFLKEIFCIELTVADLADITGFW